MKKGERNSWMIWVIVVLALMNITTIATIFYNRTKAASEYNSMNESRQPQSNDESMTFSGRYFCNNLGFDDKQMEMFREINPSFRNRVREINEGLNSLRQKMLTEMNSIDYDTTKLLAWSDSIGQLHSDLKKETFRYYEDMRKICNQEQQENLKQIFSRMFSGNSPKGRNGKGGPQNKRHGKQF